MRNQNADKRTQVDEFFKIWKEYFEQDLNTESSHGENILQSMPKTMRGTEQSTEELILLKEEITKVISSTGAVVVNGLLTEWFSVSVGVRQGCLLSPTLFNLFLDFVMDEIKCLQDHVTLDED